MSEVAEKRVNGEVTGEKQAKTGSVPNGATLNVDVAAACNGDSGHDSATSIEDQSPLGAAAVAAKAAQQTAEKAGEKQKGKGSKNKKNKNDKTKADTAGANINDNANATNGSANAEANPNSNSTANANAADEDRVITVNVAMPNGETFAFQVGMLDGVQALYAQLFDKEETCHRTCFALQLNGQTISAVSEFRALEGLTDGATLRSIDEPYSVRDARFHVRHVHSVLRSLELTAAYLGQDGASLSFCNALLNSSSVSTLENKVTRGGAEREREKAVNEFVPPDYMLPGATDLPLLPLHPLLKEGHAPRCLKELGYSRWNPPPSHRRMRGDLLYLSSSYSKTAFTT